MIAWWMTPCGFHPSLVVGHHGGRPCTTHTMAAPCLPETSALLALTTTTICSLHEEDVIRLKVAGALRVTKKAWGDHHCPTAVGSQVVEVDAVAESLSWWTAEDPGPRRRRRRKTSWHCQVAGAVAPVENVMGHLSAPYASSTWTPSVSRGQTAHFHTMCRSHARPTCASSTWVATVPAGSTAPSCTRTSPASSSTQVPSAMQTPLAVSPISP